MTKTISPTRANQPPEVIPNMPFEEYCAAPGLNQSAAKVMGQLSPAHAKARIEETITEDKACFSWGTAAHSLLLEPQTFANTVIAFPEEYPVDPDLEDRVIRIHEGEDEADLIAVQPETYGGDGKKWNNNAVECKAWNAEQIAAGRVIITREMADYLAENGESPHKPWTAAAGYCKNWEAARKAEGLVVIKKSEYDECFGWHRNLQKKPNHRSLFKSGGANELSLFWDDPVTGLRLKARIDRAPRKEYPFLIDFKTCRSAHPRDFGNAAASLWYGFQAAWYLDGWNACFPEDKKTGMLFVALEKGAPNVISYWICPDDEIAASRKVKSKLLNQWHACEKSGIWPDYNGAEGDRELNTYELPRWRQFEIDQILEL